MALGGGGGKAVVRSEAEEWRKGFLCDLGQRSDKDRVGSIHKYWRGQIILLFPSLSVSAVSRIYLLPFFFLSP